MNETTTVQLTRVQIASILAAIDHQRDTRPDMIPFAFEQLGQAEAALLVALMENADA